MAWYAPQELLEQAKKKFPHSLTEVPVLLPTAHSVVRARIDLSFEGLNIKARVVGEFKDSALLATFGAAGMGVFPAAELVHDKLTSRYDVKRLGPCAGVEEHFFAIGTDKKVVHPLVLRLLPVKMAGRA